MSVIRDPRIHSWPKIRQRDGKVILSAKVLPTWRLQALQKTLYKFLVLVWGTGVLLAGLDVLVLFLQPGEPTFLDSFFEDHVDWHRNHRIHIYLTLLGIRLMRFAETRFGHNLTRIIFGKRLRIIVTPYIVSVGGWRPRIRVSRELTTTFSLQPLDQLGDEIQKQSQQLMLVVDDSRSLKVTSIYLPHRARQIVENANMVIQLETGASGAFGPDVDPSRV